MNNSATVKIGLVGAVHPNMPGDDVGLFREIMERMDALAAELGFHLVCHSEPLCSEEDAEQARSVMDEAAVDLTLLFMPSLPFGRVMLPLARVNSRIGLWSVMEPAKSGVLQLNSFCGMNMLGSIIGNYLRRYDIRFKWFYGMPADEMFRERLVVTLQALRAIKTLQRARIGQIGGLANGFENLYIDERDLEKRFGTRVQTRHSVEEIVGRAKQIADSRVAAETASMLNDGPLNKATVATAHLDKAVRVFLALRDFAHEQRYDALAVSCWTRFQEVYGVAICSAMSRLNNEGIVAPCEGDILAAVNMLMFNAMGAGGKASLHDLVSMDVQDSSINLWHCGVAPGCWANRRGVVWDTHFNIGRYDGNEWKGEGVVADMQFKPGRVTLCTMDSSLESLFILSGDMMDNKAGFAGSSGWVNNLQLNGEPTDLRDLLNTIAVMKVNHHYPAAYGDFTNQLNEFAAWTGMGVIDKVPYKPYLQSKRATPVP